MSFLVKAVRGVTKSIPLVSDVVEFVTEPVKIVTEVVEDVVTSVPVVGDVLKPVLAVGDNTAQLVTHWASAVDGGVDVDKGNHRNHSGTSLTHSSVRCSHCTCTVHCVRGKCGD